MPYIPYPLNATTASYDLNRVYANPIALVGRQEAPFLDIIGGLDGARSWSFNQTPGRKVEWLEEEYPARTGTFTDSYAKLGGAVVTLDTTLEVDDASKIQIGSLIRVDTTGEVMWVTNRNLTAKTITVVREWGVNSVTAGDITTGDGWRMIGIAKLEGDTYTGTATTMPTSEYNFSQIFQSDYSLSGTMHEVKDQVFGIPDPKAREQIINMKKLLGMIDDSLHYGLRSANIGTAGTPRTFGGYTDFITTNVMPVDDFSLEDLNEMITELVDWGNTDPVVIASPKQYAWIKGLIKTDTQIWREQDTTTIGYQITDIDADFGRLRIMKNIRQPNHIMPILSLADIGMLTIRPFHDEDLPKTSDNHAWNTIGEYTFCLRNEKRFAIYSGLKDI